MGMAASQARYLSLTARKTNTEYEGQQVNQERTALANQSAGLLNQMLSLDVPTPPSATDFSRTYYTYNDPASANNMTIDAIYIDDTKSQGSLTYATVQITEKKPVTLSNAMYFENDTTATGDKGTFTINDPQKTNGNYTISINGGGPYTITGPNKLDSLTNTFNESINEDDGMNPAETGDYFFQFTVGGIVYYINGGQNGEGEDGKPSAKETLEGLKEADTLPVFATEGSTVTNSTTKEARLNKSNDGTGRYESITFLDANGNPASTYKLTQQTVQDEDAYNAEMDAYKAKKTVYEKAVADINSKTTIIQQQDKTLELHLDQLDTEQQAIQTEMDAVKKVIDKNIEETFKTFA